MVRIDAGKTITTKCILYYTGINYRISGTHEGTATMDWMVQKQGRSTTVISAVTTYHWTLQESCRLRPDALEYRINIINTPGHAGFAAEAKRSLCVSDGVVGVSCARGGVEPQSESVRH